VGEAQRVFRGTVKGLAAEAWPPERGEGLRRFAVETLERHLERRLMSAKALGRA
jgi:DNA repair protein RecO (recombination protein O)